MEGEDGSALASAGWRKENDDGRSKARSTSGGNIRAATQAVGRRCGQRRGATARLQAGRPAHSTPPTTCTALAGVAASSTNGGAATLRGRTRRGRKAARDAVEAAGWREKNNGESRHAAGV